MGWKARERYALHTSCIYYNKTVANRRRDRSRSRGEHSGGGAPRDSRELLPVLEYGSKASYISQRRRRLRASNREPLRPLTPPGLACRRRRHPCRIRRNRRPSRPECHLASHRALRAGGESERHRGARVRAPTVYCCVSRGTLGAAANFNITTALMNLLPPPLPSWT